MAHGKSTTPASCRRYEDPRATSASAWAEAPGKQIQKASGLKTLRKNGQFDDHPTYIEGSSWRESLQTLDAEILRFAQDDNVLAFSANCKDLSCIHGPADERRTAAKQIQKASGLSFGPGKGPQDKKT
jgi:hypothetical protein